MKYLIFIFLWLTFLPNFVFETDRLNKIALNFKINSLNNNTKEAHNQIVILNSSQPNIPEIEANLGYSYFRINQLKNAKKWLKKSCNTTETKVISFAKFHLSNIALIEKDTIFAINFLKESLISNAQNKIASNNLYYLLKTFKNFSKQNLALLQAEELPQFKNEVLDELKQKQINNMNLEEVELILKNLEKNDKLPIKLYQKQPLDLSTFKNW